MKCSSDACYNSKKDNNSEVSFEPGHRQLLGTVIQTYNFIKIKMVMK